LRRSTGPPEREDLLFAVWRAQFEASLRMMNERESAPDGIFGERQVTVSAKRDSGHQNLLLFGHSSTEIPVRVAP
jgi:hypothetical protein